MTFTLMPRKVEERVPAWEVCQGCISDAATILPCPTCKGDGGKWHEAVVYNQLGYGITPKKYHYINDDEIVTKSSFILREWDACVECEGSGLSINQPPMGDMAGMTAPCGHCLKDKDGKPTGAGKDTASEWRVEK